ncbi:nesprin-2 [Aplochiton taeniatus]
MFKLSLDLPYSQAFAEVSLQAEAGVRLVCLDDLTQKNRTLVRLFHGTMRGRLLTLTRDCGFRWDALNARIETATHRHRHFVSQWEEFESEREELMMWLADMDLRLSELEHLIGGTTCDRMTEIQSFQEAVCVNSGRVNALLERGEALIHCSSPGDAQEVESQLWELLLYCTQVFNSVGRLHTRLISMRLVFEDDWRLAQGSDSGCPSETPQEEEGALDKRHLDLPVFPSVEAPCNPALPTAQGTSFPANPSPAPPPPPSPSPPTLDHLVLEWDPSVDIGGSLSHHDGDSAYFSANTGLCRRRRPLARDGVKRRSYLSSLGSIDSQSDIANQEVAEPVSEKWLSPAHVQVFPPVKTQDGRTDSLNGQWMTSTPDGQASEPMGFDAARIQKKEQKSLRDKNPSQTQPRSLHVAVVEGSWPLPHPAFLYLLLGLALTLLAGLAWGLLEPDCKRATRLAPSFHLVLRYVNGPPPT